ncbi:hypothetical protein EFA69_13535 [Rufibacter immobilis]|uniref:Uncharacterized protein n=1 Tax=Rufibacter immobilis TaxID=1348778 RepID=A0A3M9MNR4_9BACT|nr:hypothetical protein [Rufibacter immobilis]RNI27184.1 hypothetical protein EFA69_13535 [Rufibacter immobilis]
MGDIECEIEYGYKFEITNGKGLLKIRSSEYLDYLEYKSPKIIHWLDSGPSTTLCDYLTSLPLSWKIKKEIDESMNQELLGPPEEINRLAFERLEPLLDIFENGKYAIFHTYLEENTKLLFSPIIEETIDYHSFYSRYDKFESDDKDFKANNLLVEPYGRFFWVTATQREINIDRVEHYLEEINAGKKPTAVIFTSFFEKGRVNFDGSISEESVRAEYYVIDGHHKLLAYEKAGVAPSTIIICHLPNSLEEILPNLEDLSKVVQPYQFARMVYNLTPTEKLVTNAINGSNELIKNYLNKYSYYSPYSRNKTTNSPGFNNNNIQKVEKMPTILNRITSWLFNKNNKI